MRMTLNSLSKPGHSTIVEYEELRLDAGVKDSVFTVKNLQKRR